MRSMTSGFQTSLTFVCDRLTAEERFEDPFAQNDKSLNASAGLMMRTASPSSDPCAPAVKSQRLQQTFRH
jgi:hypothetical protein